MASIWVDYLERDFLKNGFREMVDSGLVSGITSNPAIFSKAIVNSDSYKESIGMLGSRSPEEIYESLAVEDIRTACDILSDLYDEGEDGFASIEVDPRLANDHRATIDEAMRLADRIERENLMIKIPATEAGYKAMEDLARRGLNINATLVFSPNQAARCAEALSHLQRSREGVISVFVSRFDRELNPLLASAHLSKDRVGFFNAIKIYNQIAEKRLPNVRVLFASTGVKQPWLEADYYVEQLNLPNSVLTLPLEVLDVVRDKELQPSFEFQTKHIDAFLSYLTPLNISMQATYEKLMKEGLKAFEDSFTDLLESLGNAEGKE
jgi:transaldolase